MATQIVKSYAYITGNAIDDKVVGNTTKVLVIGAIGLVDAHVLNHLLLHCFKVSDDTRSSKKAETMLVPRPSYGSHLCFVQIA
ncbi:hypothetical protein BZA77DRAFT_354324 [Pyronema omphalodes]|nr:hypothetical protein BZA77DRAFT_354324 [Pyronema omphalodes]